MYKFCVAVCIALYLSAATGSFVEDTVEDLAYLALKKGLVASGDTPFHADCAVKVLRATGTTKDVTEILLDPDTVLDKLNQKARFADFICSPPGLVVAVLLLGCAFFVCCCCCCCMCRTKKPIIIQVPSHHLHSRTATVPYVKMDVAQVMV